MYNPNEPRDESGKWTAFDASHALLEAASGKKIFKEAKNIQEVEERMKQLGIKHINLNGYGLEQANATLHALEKVPNSAIPDAIGNGKAFADFTNRPIGRKAHEWYGVSVDYPDITIDGKTTWGSFKIMAINTREYKTLNSITSKKIDFNNKWQSKNGNKWYFNTDGKLTHFHELGHVYDNRKFSISQKDEWKNIADKWNREAKYGVLKNSSEAFAEGFADFYGNGGERLPDYVKEFFKKHQ